MDINNLLLVACLPLACWRFSVMLVRETGPFEVFEWIRHKTRNTMLGDLLSCVHCTSIWVSAGLLVAIHSEAGQWVVIWLALSAVTILYEKVINGIRTPPGL